MKESSASLRWYFGVVGMWALFSEVFFGAANIFLGRLNLLADSPFALLSLSVGLITAFFCVYFAFTLPKFLNPEKEKYVTFFLLAALCVSVIVSLVDSYPTITGISYFRVAGRILIAWYLYHNVHKLSNIVGPAYQEEEHKTSRFTKILAAFLLFICAIAVLGFLKG